MSAQTLTEKQRTAHFDQFGLNTVERGLVTRLMRLHGHCTLHRKADGSVEVRMADPDLLEEDGDKELTSRHLYVNVTKYVRENHTCAACCVKTGKVWNVDTLLRMLPVEMRAQKPARVKRRLSVFEVRDMLEPGRGGELLPIDPGEIIPLDRIDDPAHPALVYLQERGFEPGPLVDQFRAAYCVKRDPRLRTPRMPGDLCPAPEGRIVFFADMDGRQVGWQARRLELRRERNLLHWNPNTGHWANVGRYGEEGRFVVHDRYDGTRIGRDRDYVLERKYFNAPGMQTGKVLLGFDAAVRWRMRTGIKTIGLVEGVFDAARLGPPFVSMLGLTLKPGQARHLLGQGFDRVVYLCDRDGNPENAERTRESMKHLEGIIGRVDELSLPPGRKDAAEITRPETDRLREEAGL